MFSILYILQQETSIDLGIGEDLKFYLSSP